MNTVRSRRVFFFPHGLDKARDEVPRALNAKMTPWRVPISVVGMRVSNSSANEAEGVVMGDGFRTREEPPLLGGNQDPCIFSAPLGPLHVFCRIGRRKGRDNDVVLLGGIGSGRLLPDVVGPGDIVIYGKPEAGAVRVAVDTVIVVEKVATFGDVLAQVGADSDAFRFSLSDALPLGSHAGENGQRVIIGRSNPTWSAVESLSTSFVPLAAENVDRRREVLRVEVTSMGDQTALFDVFREQMFSGGGALENKGRLCELPGSAGEALVRAVIEQSGRTAGCPGAVFVPPLRPRGALRRLGGDGGIRKQVDHLARLSAEADLGA